MPEATLMDFTRRAPAGPPCAPVRALRRGFADGTAWVACVFLFVRCIERPGGTRTATGRLPPKTAGGYTQTRTRWIAGCQQLM